MEFNFRIHSVWFKVYCFKPNDEILFNIGKKKLYRAFLKGKKKIRNDVENKKKKNLKLQFRRDFTIQII